MGDSAARGLDVYSTHRALSCTCNHEVELPGFIAKHTPVMAAYSASEVVLQFWVYRKLSPRHPKLAHAVTMFDLTATSASVARNFTMHVPPSGIDSHKIL
jgi:hypothetical protein